MLVLEGCEDLLPLGLPLASLLPSFFLSLAELLSVPLLALPNLIAEIQRSKSVNQAIFILEALLRHVECLLHGHGEGDADGENEANKKQNNVEEINPMRRTSRRADESQLLEVHEPVVDKCQQDWSKDKEAEVDYHSGYCLHKRISALESQHGGQRGANQGSINGIALEYDSKMGLGLITLLVWLGFQHLPQLDVLDKGLSQDFKVDNDDSHGDHRQYFHG